MPLELEVTWTMSGTSQMTLDDEHARQALAAGVTEDDGEALYEFVAKRWPDRYGDLDEEWTDRDKPDVTQVMVWGDPPEESR